RAELAVERVDVHREALGVAPVGERVELDVARGAPGVHAGVEARAGRAAHVPASTRAGASRLTCSRYAFTASTPRRSVIGPWPGTISAASRARIRSQAAIQLETGPSHTMGVPSTKRMSPVKTARSPGRWTITSPRVCA